MPSFPFSRGILISLRRMRDRPATRASARYPKVRSQILESREAF